MSSCFFVFLLRSLSFNLNVIL